MNSISISSTPINGVSRIQRVKKEDSRGFLSRLFCIDTLAQAGWSKNIAQINHTLTKKVGTVRGMHFQNVPHTEMKLVTCIRGAVWDVALDLRKNSPTFLQWYAEELSFDNQTALLLPEGVAHGFQVLEPDSELIYCHSENYHSEAEGGLHPLDPRLAIEWPLEVCGLSNRDCSHPFISSAFRGVSQNEMPTL